MYGSSGWLALNVSTSTLPFQQRKCTVAFGGRRVHWLWWQMRRRRREREGKSTHVHCDPATSTTRAPHWSFEIKTVRTRAQVGTYTHTLVRQRKHGLTCTLSATARWGLCLLCQHVRQRTCLHKARGRGQSLAVGDGSHALLSRHRWTLSLCVRITQGGYSLNGWGGMCVWMNRGKLLVVTTLVNCSADWGTSYHSQIIGFERLSNCEYFYFFRKS